MQNYEQLLAFVHQGTLFGEEVAWESEEVKPRSMAMAKIRPVRCVFVEAIPQWLRDPEQATWLQIYTQIFGTLLWIPR